MEQKRKGEALRQQCLIEGKRIPAKGIRAEIAAAWKRSLARGLDPNMEALPPPQSEEAIHPKWVEAFGPNIPPSREHILRFSKYLEGAGAVLLNLNWNRIALSAYGSQALMKDLKEANIAVGGDFSEDAVGVTAASLVADEEDSPKYAVGDEHYIKALTPYATLAAPMHRSKEYSPGVYLMIMPRERFYQGQQILLEMLAQQMSLAWTANELRLFSLNLQHFFDQNNIGYILVATDGTVFHINSYLAGLGFGEQRPLFTPLMEMFPELKLSLECLRTGKSIISEEVIFHRAGEKRMRFFMSCDFIPSTGMCIILRSAHEVQRTVAQVANYTAHYTKDDLIGNSKTFVNVKRVVDIAARTDITVLITGESGTGKELFAQAIHNAGNRKNAPFISINCASIPRELISSELFGYAPGAFTGANKRGAIGKFELANHGTLFLDEIAEIPMEMQVVLLRALEERCVQRLGDKYPSPVDVKVIAATNKNLLEAVEAREFRLDLYYRLNTLHIEVPPLRDREEDVRELAYYFLDKFRQSVGSKARDFDPEVLTILAAYHWPGNVRELRNTIERACIVCESEMVTPNDLPQDILLRRSAHSAPSEQPRREEPRKEGISEIYESMEREKILELMLKHNGNKTKVAEELGITRATLYKRMKKFGGRRS